MRRVYRVLSWLIVVEVVVQAAAIALGLGGLVHHVSEGGVVDKASLEDSELGWVGEVGFPIHFVNGGVVIPLLALALLVVAFFAHVPKGIRTAAWVFGLVVVQVMLGYSITDVPFTGAVHGANALALLVVAMQAARLAAVRAPADAVPTEVPADARG
jgi:hypothetical protein